MWMSNITHENEPFDTYKWFISHMRMSHVTYARVMTHIWHLNESRQAWEWVISRMWMCHVTHENKSCHTCECVISQMWTWHVTPVRITALPHMNESWHTYGWIMSHIWMSHVTHAYESHHTCEWVTARLKSRQALWWMSHPLGMAYVKVRDVCEWVTLGGTFVNGWL